MRIFAAAVLLALCVGSAVSTSPASLTRSCPVTIPPADWQPSGPEFGPGRFNYGNARIRAALYWPRGVLTAGTLPTGGVMAVIERDGSISLKLGWWRGIPGRLVITGRRLDRAAGRVRADVPPNESYGDVGFIPSSITFPSVGCWRVTGKQGGASLTFVVRVTKAKPGTSAMRCHTTAANGNTPARGQPRSLFGNGRMAASAYRVIKVDSRTWNHDGSIGEKFWWYGAPDVKGELRISGYRLDRRGGKVTGSVSPGTDTAYPDLRFWAVGVRFPTVGCWKVIGTAGTDSLALVVLVRR